MDHSRSVWYPGNTTAFVQVDADHEQWADCLTIAGPTDRDQLSEVTILVHSFTLLCAEQLARMLICRSWLLSIMQMRIVKRSVYKECSCSMQSVNCVSPLLMPLLRACTGFACYTNLIAGDMGSELVKRVFPKVHRQ